MKAAFDKNHVEETSFRKKGSAGRRIPGTKMSYQNVQLLTSTGVPSLDSYLGGGIAVGTVLLVEEDFHNAYARVLVRCFLAEGVTHFHAVFLASGNIPPEKILKELPSAVEPKPPSYVPEGCNDLKIAWRYKDQRSPSEPLSTHSFDLSKSMPREKLDGANICMFNPSSCDWVNDLRKGFLKEPFQLLFTKIKQTIQKENLQSTGKHSNNILRIVIPSFGSPLWMDERDSDMYALLRFLYMLRSLLRSSSTAALITLPKTLLQSNPKLQDKIRQMCDYVIQLESFALAPKVENPIMKDFDGLLNIVKLPVLNTFMYQIPTMDLAFKLRRKTFHVEQLHLPPDIGEMSVDALPCSSTSSPLDF